MLFYYSALCTFGGYKAQICTIQHASLQSKLKEFQKLFKVT